MTSSNVFLCVALLFTVSAQQDGLGSYASIGQHIAISPTISKNIPHVYQAPVQTQYLVGNSAPIVRSAIPVVERYTHSSSNTHPSAPAYPSPVIALASGFGASEHSAPALAVPEYSSGPRLTASELSSPRLTAPAQPQHYREEYAHPKYEYAYSIEDYHTGDSHSQQEQRDGDHVAGQYSLREADGTIRVVKYFDEGHGFNVVIESQGLPENRH